MNSNSMQRNYLRAAVQQASPAGLVVILCDLLVGDLRRAAASMQNSDVEERSGRLKHALSALQVLEGSLDLEKGGETAQCLAQFYSHIRSQILRAQFQNDSRIIEQQIALILSVRGAWQEVSCDLAARTGDRQTPPDGFESLCSAANRGDSSDWSA